MLRAVLAALVVLSAGACSHHDDAPVVQVGQPAGDVVEVTGTVTATGSTGTRTLKPGDKVTADDAIDTGTGRVAIVLLHNGARWELGPDHHGAKVAESAAWKLAKLDSVAKPVDEQSTPAGREAEHHAVDTVATTTPSSGSAPERPAAAEPDRASPSEPVRPTAAQAGAAPTARPTPTSPPPPPPVQPAQQHGQIGGVSSSKEVQGDKDGAPGGGTVKVDEKTSDDELRQHNRRGAVDQRTVVAADPALRACLVAKAHLVIACTAGTCTVTSTDITEPVRACLVDRLAAMKLADGKLTIDLAK